MIAWAQQGPVGEALDGMRRVVEPSSTRWAGYLVDFGIYLAIAMTLAMCISMAIRGKLHQRLSLWMIWGITIILPITGLIVSYVGNITK